MCREEFAERVDRAVFPGLQGGPFMHAIAAKAVAFKEAMEPSFKAHQRQVVKNAKVMADAFTTIGFRPVTGGTDNHLILIDLTSTYEKLSGRQAADHLEEAGIIVNKNTIPFDKRSAVTTSGIRLGSPMTTTRGMKEAEMRVIVDLISETLEGRRNSEVKKLVQKKVNDLCQQFPIYEDFNPCL